MAKSTRREFIRMAGTGALGTSILSAMGGCVSSETEHRCSKSDIKLKLGITSYTFRKFSLDDTITMTKKLDLKYISLKSFHLPLDSTVDQIKAAASKVREAGLDLYGCGVVSMRTEEAVNQAFEYAKTAQMRVIIGVPGHDLLELVDKKVKEYDIKVAIHNHGPGDKHYPSPQSVYEKVKDLDPRIGLCIDAGHTKRIGLDPSEEAVKYFDRLHDVHIKDVSAAEEAGSTVEIGRGVIDIPKFLKTLIKLNYQGIVSLEYEKDEQDPLAGAAESIGYERGVLAVI
jgi:sugar phosphate isomerase/epimerase